MSPRPLFDLPLPYLAPAHLVTLFPNRFLAGIQRRKTTGSRRRSCSLRPPFPVTTAHLRRHRPNIRTRHPFLHAVRYSTASDDHRSDLAVDQQCRTSPELPRR
jgi:hypothetical protein